MIIMTLKERIKESLFMPESIGCSLVIFEPESSTIEIPEIQSKVNLRVRPPRRSIKADVDLYSVASAQRMRWIYHWGFGHYPISFGEARIVFNPNPGTNITNGAYVKQEDLDAIARVLKDGFGLDTTWKISQNHLDPIEGFIMNYQI